MDRDEYPKVTIGAVDCLGKGNALIGGQYWLFFGMALLATLIMSSVPLILNGPLYCGLYLCFRSRERGEQVPFERLFKGFDVFVDSFIATLIQTAVVLAVGAPFMIGMLACFIGGGAAMEERNEDLGVILFIVGGLIALAFTVVCLIITVLFMFSYPLIVDRKLKAVDAVRTSVRACRANFWGLAWLMILNSLIALAACLACYVPLFFFLPIMFASYWIAYRKVFPALPADEENEAGGAALDAPEVA